MCSRPSSEPPLITNMSQCDKSLRTLHDFPSQFRNSLTRNVALHMNKTTIAMTAVLMAAALTGIFATSTLAYAEGGDSSETSTDQKLKQKNVGSGDAEQNNCAEQLIKAGASDNCRFIN